MQMFMKISLRANVQNIMKLSINLTVSNIVYYRQKHILYKVVKKIKLKDLISSIIKIM